MWKDTYPTYIVVCDNNHGNDDNGTTNKNDNTDLG